MITKEQRTEMVRYWWLKVQDSLSSARREFEAGSYSFAMNRLYYAAFYVTVHRFRVQRSGLKTKKALKIQSPHYKCSFSQVIANLASNVGLGLTKLTLLS
ncbi:MAG: hypothetical protein SRB2_03005 [Desulfobacteraceae bacterium Eth-SRB2]|nr:MAG: hypothetical protein SRB2_03005 [Desulfobacteraceae bacterium Eth-SRB2]